MATKRLIVRGRVQGVGYRMSMLYSANNLGLKGWVRNRRDGSVEAMAQGPDADVQKFIEWAHRGPDLARVDSVDVLEGSGHFSQFEVKDTE